MSVGMEAVQRFVAALPEGATSKVDPPDQADGMWFVDVTIEDQLEVVAWQSGRGYGLWDMPEPTYGQNPNVVVPEPAEAVARMLGIMAKAREGLAPRA